MLCDRRRNSCGSKRLISTKCWPISKAIVAWSSGVVTQWHRHQEGIALLRAQAYPIVDAPAVAADFDELGSPGCCRPTPSTSSSRHGSGSGPSDNVGSGTKPAGTLGSPGCSAPRAARVAAIPADPRTPPRAARGQRLGTAPSFQQATAPAPIQWSWGNAMVT